MVNEQSSFVIRPVCEEDLEKLVQLAGAIRSPIYTLLPDRSFLEAKMHDSMRSFYPVIKEPGHEQYFFVLENLENQAIIGTSAVFARVGGYKPFYSYEIKETEFTHKPLGIKKSVKELHLDKIHEGPSELGSLFLYRDYRRFGLGKLLSLSRFFFMGIFRERFQEEVIAELRGYADVDGMIPFWEALGRHFFEHDFADAERYSALSNKEFIADLMPQHPIYVSLLPKEVQEIIGEVHPDTKPALRMLLDEGFKKTKFVDIFDAGPTVLAKTEEIHTISQLNQGTVTIVENLPEETMSGILSNTKLDFRACLADYEAKEGTIMIDQKTAERLMVGEEDRVAFMQ